MRVLKKEEWPFKVTMGYDESTMKITEMEQWLIDNLSSYHNKWNVVYQFNSTDFYFRDREDAMMFKLTNA